MEREVSSPASGSSRQSEPDRDERRLRYADTAVAEAKIKAARIPYRVPSAEDLPARVSGVLVVLDLVFNEGYLATGPDTDPLRPALTAEAIRLARLIRALLPDDGETAGLLALMLLTEARRPTARARVSATGELVTLDQQDRAGRAAYDKAIELAGNTAETAYLTRRRDDLG